jgi:hypothetical protein
VKTRHDRVLLAIRLRSGGVFVALGAGKFVNHASELPSFKTRTGCRLRTSSSS